jgi:hypothetical protein
MNIISSMEALKVEEFSLICVLYSSEFRDRIKYGHWNSCRRKKTVFVLWVFFFFFFLLLLYALV